MGRALQFEPLPCPNTQCSGRRCHVNNDVLTDNMISACDTAYFTGDFFFFNRSIKHKGELTQPMYKHAVSSTEHLRLLQFNAMC